MIKTTGRFRLYFFSIASATVIIFLVFNFIWHFRLHVELGGSEILKASHMRVSILAVSGFIILFLMWIFNIRAVFIANSYEKSLQKEHDKLESEVRKRSEKLTDANIKLQNQLEELKRAATAFRESQIKFHAAFDQTFQLMGLLTTDGTLVAANKSALQIVNGKESDILGKPFWQTPWWAHSSDMQNKVRDGVEKAALGQFVRFEATHIGLHGTMHYIDFSIKPVKDEFGTVIMLIPEGRDITERKIQERLLKNAYDELRRTQAQLLQSAKMSAIGQLAAGAAHEINNPLSVISGEAEILLMDDKIDKDTRLAVTTIAEQVKRIVGIITRLLSFSRQAVPERKPVDINKIVEESLGLLSYQTKLEGIEVVKKNDADLPKISADPNQLEEVLINIMLNGVQSMERGGVLSVKTDKVKLPDNIRSHAGEMILIEIKDTGKGIHEEDLDNLFKPFFTSRKNGVGLGLFVCMGIIKNYSGTIEVKSKVGEGATFTIKIPVARTKENA